MDYGTAQGKLARPVTTQQNLGMTLQYLLISLMQFRCLSQVILRQVKKSQPVGKIFKEYGIAGLYNYSVHILSLICLLQALAHSSKLRASVTKR